MGTARTYNPSTTNGHPGPVQVAVFDLTAGAAGTDSAITDESLNGEVVKIEIDPGAALKVTTSTIKGYEYDTALATAKRDHFVDYAVPNPAVEVVFYPLFESGTTVAGAALTTKASQRKVVAGRLRVDLAGSDAADAVTVRVYVK